MPMFHEDVERRMRERDAAAAARAAEMARDAADVTFVGRQDDRGGFDAEEELDRRVDELLRAIAGDAAAPRRSGAISDFVFGGVLSCAIVESVESADGGGRPRGLEGWSPEKASSLTALALEDLGVAGDDFDACMSVADRVFSTLADDGLGLPSREPA